MARPPDLILGQARGRRREGRLFLPQIEPFQGVAAPFPGHSRSACPRRPLPDRPASRRVEREHPRPGRAPVRDWLSLKIRRRRGFPSWPAPPGAARIDRERMLSMRSTPCPAIRPLLRRLVARAGRLDEGSTDNIVMITRLSIFAKKLFSLCSYRRRAACGLAFATVSRAELNALSAEPRNRQDMRRKGLGIEGLAAKFPAQASREFLCADQGMRREFFFARSRELAPKPKAPMTGPANRDRPS